MNKEEIINQILEEYGNYLKSLTVKELNNLLSEMENNKMSF